MRKLPTGHWRRSGKESKPKHTSLGRQLRSFEEHDLYDYRDACIWGAGFPDTTTVFMRRRVNQVKRGPKQKKIVAFSPVVLSCNAPWN